MRRAVARADWALIAWGACLFCIGAAACWALKTDLPLYLHHHAPAVVTVHFRARSLT